LKTLPKEKVDCLLDVLCRKFNLMNQMLKTNPDEQMIDSKRQRYIERMKDYNAMILDTSSQPKEKPKNPFRALLKMSKDNFKNLAPEDHAIAQKGVDEESGTPQARQKAGGNKDKPKVVFDIKKIDRMATLIDSKRVRSESNSEVDSDFGDSDTDDDDLDLSKVSSEKSKESGLEYSFSQKSDQTLKQ
jgi:hypothetical protein